ncbi:hypothetical protein VM1G_00154 [Cytospora mali]|uniref:Uncharacterized protein n=1 Tax=Cytospora mali TaxID=578113 RepID=A0A194VNL9_CYTMA|nr:hypothetical protein VM1G_00154 [Valsa mali]
MEWTLVGSPGDPGACLPIGLNSPFAPAMDRKKAARSDDYLADSESSDLLYQMDQSSPIRMRRTLKPTKPRHVTVRTPSEEDLFERTYASGHHRESTPSAIVRYSTSDEEEAEGHKTAKARDCRKAVTESATAPSGTSTTSQNGTNQVYTHSHATQPGNIASQPSIITNPQTITTAYPYAIHYPGQPAPFLIANATTMDGYQNSGPSNNGLNFQPQVPDTSLGPMMHTYRPSYDNGVYVAHPGIAPIRPMNVAQAPLVAAPVVPSTVVVCPTYFASAQVCTTMGYMGEDTVVAPREVVVAGPQGVAVPFQAGPATGPILPIVAQQQPYQAQPMMIAGGVQAGQPVMMAAPGGGGGVPPGQPVLVNGGPAPMMGGVGGQPAFMMPGNNNTFLPVHNEPATGIGETAGQVAAAYMTNPELNEPQDFKPADDNPSRMYMVRQLDGQYIQMPRITIDSFGKNARWYVTDEGVFYAVRLEP